jgi:hypothetical protein
VDVNQFNLSLRNFAAVDVPKKIQEIHQKVAMEALKSLVMKTRVKTGRARGNWQVENDNRPAAALLTTDKDGQPTIQRGLTTIAQARPFSVTYITNNVRYIVFLEDGRGSFAGDHMMARTIEEAKRMFR